MHIPRPKLSKTEIGSLIDDLNSLIIQPSAAQSPPCPNCELKATLDMQHGVCNAGCYNAPQALSEDPLRYPIEEFVVPLVFELTSMRLVQTCWSCQGHLDIDGKIWKLPQVSFYSKKAIYSQLLCNYLSRLHWHKILKYPWEVVLTNYGRTWDITYTIRCDISQISKPNIQLMHQDLLRMAENLSEVIKDDARSLVSDIKSNLPAIHDA